MIKREVSEELEDFQEMAEATVGFTSGGVENEGKFAKLPGRSEIRVT